MEVEIVEIHELFASNLPDPADAVADRELVDAVMRRLDEQGRSIIVLHYFLGLPISEVATTLGIPAGTVKSRLNRALGEMRSEAHASAPTPSLASGGTVA
jgi:RNA polymerase sigma-70 factor (ECF subfamily)